MKNVITISREFGSGGHTVGEQIAEKLGYKFYDKEIFQSPRSSSGAMLLKKLPKKATVLSSEDVQITSSKIKTMY